TNSFGTRTNDGSARHREQTFDQHDNESNNSLSSICSQSWFDDIPLEEIVEQSSTCTISHKPIREHPECNVATHEETLLKDITDLLSTGQRQSCGDSHIRILPEYYLTRTHLLLWTILLTVCHNEQYYFHTDTFLRDNKNEEISPSNPIYFDVDKHDFLTDGMIPNFALSTRKVHQTLRSFNPPENCIHPCRTIVGHDKLRETFQLETLSIFTLCV
ncbi:unnamed protein product, partial [Didymodactylos carnosus]